MIRALVILLAFISPFLFPWPLSLLLLVAAACFLPLTAILIGVLTDAAYYSPGAAFLPMATLAGILACVLGLVVHRFVKARIIGG